MSVSLSSLANLSLSLSYLTSVKTYKDADAREDRPLPNDPAEEAPHGYERVSVAFKALCFDSSFPVCHQSHCYICEFD